MSDRLREWFDSLDEEVLSNFDEFQDASCLDFDDQVEQVLTAMYGIDPYGSVEVPVAPGCTYLTWSKEIDGDGSIVGWSVGVSPGGTPLSFRVYLDWEDMTNDQSAIGRDQAWAIVQSVAQTVADVEQEIDRMRSS